MQLLVIETPFRMETLVDELLAAFPEWIGEQFLPDVGHPEPLALFSLTGKELRFPDGTDPGVVQAVIDGHDPVPEHPVLLRKRLAREKVAAAKGTKLNGLSQAEAQDLLEALVELEEV
jgi:enoyl-CoA hydratase/carnithine racemase